MRPAKIVAIVIGVLLILIGLGVLVPGVILLGINGAADNQGFLNTPAHALNSDGHALTTPDIKLHIGNGDWIPGDWSARIQAASTGDAPVFIGVGSTADVMNYLSDVAYDQVTNLSWTSDGNTAQYTNHSGSSDPAPPAEQNFWVATQAGAGVQSLEWPIRSGDWTAVVMNADGSAPVAVTVKLGAHLGFLFPLGLGLTIGGVVLLAIGIFLIVMGARKSRRPEQQYAYPGGPPAGMQPPYGQPPYGQAPYGQPPYTPHAPPPYGQHPQGQPPMQPQGQPQYPPQPTPPPEDPATPTAP